jgi:tetratricopeptide (TPR) repeat protein
MWVEDSLYALLNSSNSKEAFELEDSTPDCRAIVVKKEHLQLSRGKLPDLTVEGGLEAAGINVRRIRPEEIPFQFDTLLRKAHKEKENGNWSGAAGIYEYIGNHYQNQIWMRSLAADALYHAGNFKKADEFVSSLNQQFPTADTLLLEGKIKRRNGDYKQAVTLLKNAKDILESKVEASVKIPLTVSQ